MIWWDLMQSLHAHLQTELSPTVVQISGGLAATPDQQQVNILRGDDPADWVDEDQRQSSRKFYLELWGYSADGGQQPALSYANLAQLEDATGAALNRWSGSNEIKVMVVRKMASRPDADSFLPAVMNEWELHVGWIRQQIAFGLGD